MAGELEELHHLRLIFEKFELHAGVVLLGVEEKHFPRFDAAAVQLVDEALGLLALQRVVGWSAGGWICRSRFRR